jgi:glyoxylase-like metal-dependent hydrolase (beta-lactamase superfamily II)
VSFFDEEGNLLFDGDVLFDGGIGRTDLPGGSMAEIMHSIREVLFKLPDETIVYSGHGNPTTIGREKATNPWLG